MVMMTTIRATMLKLDPYELKLAIHLVGMLLMHDWMSMINAVSRKT